MARESLRQALVNPRMAALVGLGFAAGLPSQWFLLGSTLQSAATDAGIDIVRLGLLSAVGLPFAFNFVWAPLLDRYRAPWLHRFGRRRGWLLLIQSALLVAIMLLAGLLPDSPDQPLSPLMAMGMLVAFLAASQDVVADAYRTDVLTDEELGLGAGVFVNGYRVAMLVAGGGALWLADHGWTWQQVYLLMGALMGVGLVTTFFAPPAPVQDRPPTLAQSVVDPMLDFIHRKGWALLAILAFILVAKLPDQLVGRMTTPLLQRHLEISKTAIAWTRDWLGLAVFIPSTLAGGALMVRWPIVRALWLFLILQAVSNLGYFYLSMVGPAMDEGDLLWALTVVVVVENVCAGLVTAGFIAFLMSQCNRRYSATQYALFTSLMAGSGAIIGSLTGWMVEVLGYAEFFLISVAAALPGLALLLVLGRTIGRSDQDVEEAIDTGVAP